MKNLLMYVWQLPQNIIGLIMVYMYNPSRVHILEDGTEVYYSYYIRGGVSMGKYVIINSGHYRKNVDDSLRRDTVRYNAVGKVRLSRWFGWLYLLLSPFINKWANKIAGIR